jgi:hypothetical protein
MTMIRTRLREIALLAIWCWLVPAARAGQLWTFTKVADTSTAVPDGSGTFTDFDAPSLRNGEVVFQGYGGPNRTVPGIYTGRAGGPVGLVADTNTQAPGR